MKKVFYPLACLAAGALVACGGQKSGSAQADQPNEVALAYSKSLKAPETDSLKLPVDENGYITIFDGKTFDGWRGYGKDKVPAKWTIEDGCIKFNGTGVARDPAGGPAEEPANPAIRPRPPWAGYPDAPRRSESHGCPAAVHWLWDRRQTE